MSDISLYAAVLVKLGELLPEQTLVTESQNSAHICMSVFLK